MANNDKIKPSAEQFRKAVRDLGGNLSKVAEAFGVARGTVYSWRDNDPAFMQAIKDERTRLFDECLATSRVVALGIPKYEWETDINGEIIYDDNGNPIRRMVGWAVAPDPNMLRYFMSVYGKYDKFGFTDEDGTGLPAVNEGIDIHSWLEVRNEGRKKKGK